MKMTAGSWISCQPADSVAAAGPTAAGALRACFPFGASLVRGTALAAWAAKGARATRKTAAAHNPPIVETVTALSMAPSCFSPPPTVDGAGVTWKPHSCTAMSLRKYRHARMKLFTLYVDSIEARLKVPYSCRVRCFQNPATVVRLPQEWTLCTRPADQGR